MQNELQLTVAESNPLTRSRHRWIILAREDYQVLGRIGQCNHAEAHALLNQIAPGKRMRVRRWDPRKLSPKQLNEASSFPWMTPFRFARFGIFLPRNFPRAEHLRTSYFESLAAETRASTAIELLATEAGALVNSGGMR